MTRLCSRLPLACLLLVSGGLMFAQIAPAQNLPDPTRPPTAMMASPVNSGAPAGPVLQSILIGPNRHVATISGQTVAVNGKYGDHTLIRLTETEAVLRSDSKGKELLTLKLFPDLEKKLSRDSGK